MRADRDGFGDHGLEQLFLALEVEVGKSLADRCFLGDILELGGGEASGDEEFERCTGDFGGAVFGRRTRAGRRAPLMTDGQYPWPGI